MPALPDYLVGVQASSAAICQAVWCAVVTTTITSELHTHGDLATIVGPYTWGAIHYLVNRFPCEPCAATGRVIFNGVHDLFNIRLGKPMQFPDDFKALVDEIRLALASLASLKDVTTIQPLARFSLPAARTVTTVAGTEVARLARAVGINGFTRTCTPAAAKRWESCVVQVKEKGGANPYAVCTASVGCSPDRR